MFNVKRGQNGLRKAPRKCSEAVFARRQYCYFYTHLVFAQWPIPSRLDFPSRKKSRPPGRFIVAHFAGNKGGGGSSSYVNKSRVPGQHYRYLGGQHSLIFITKRVMPIWEHLFGTSNGSMRSFLKPS